MPKYDPKMKDERGLKQLEDGRWRASLIGAKGENIRRVYSGKQEARQFRDSERNKVQATKQGSRSRDITFDEMTVKFLADGKLQLRPSTLEKDRQIVNKWLSFPGFKGKRLRDLRPEDVRRYVHLRASSTYQRGKDPELRQLSPRAVNLELSRLKTMLNQAIDLQHLEFNPAQRIKRLKGEVERIRCLEPDEEVRLLAAADQVALAAERNNSPTWCAARLLRPMICLTILTGLRRGEILGMTWENVYLEKLGEERIFLPAKLTKGKRDQDVLLSPKAVEILKSLPLEDRKGLVFHNSRGKPLTNLERNWRRAIKISGIEDYRWHDGRHTVATRLRAKGIDSLDLKDILRHKDIKMTARYAHPTASKLREAVNLLDQGGDQEEK